MLALNQADRKAASTRMHRRMLYTFLRFQLKVAAAVAAVIAWGTFVFLAPLFDHFGIGYVGLTLIFIPGALAVGAVLLWETLRMIERICEPGIRVVQCLKQLQSGGHPDAVRCDYTNEFRPLVETFNESLDLLYDTRAVSLFESQRNVVEPYRGYHPETHPMPKAGEFNAHIA